jgi:hypothetical protein
MILLHMHQRRTGLNCALEAYHTNLRPAIIWAFSLSIRDLGGLPLFSVFCTFRKKIKQYGNQEELA